MKVEPLKMMFRGEMRKWDVVKTASNGQEAIVISDPIERSGHACITLYPYKRKKTKFGRWLWFKILKLKLFLKIIKP